MTRGKKQSPGQASGPRHSTANLARQAKNLPFEPKVIFEEGECTIRLPELGLVVTGVNYEAAKAEMLEEVRSYADLYLNDEDMRRDPTRRNHFRLVRYAQSADEKGMLDRLVFAPLTAEG